MTIEHVTFPSGLGEAIVYGDPEDWTWDEDYDSNTDSVTLEYFQENFEVVKGKHLGDPKESWYQGVNFTRVIRRKSDGKLFGYAYWEPVAKHGEIYVEANGDEHGYGYETYVFLPVELFTVTGYQVQEEKK